MKKYLIILISFVIVFSSCSPDAGNKVDDSFTVDEIGDAVADAVKGSKAAMPSNAGTTTYQVSSKALFSDISIDEMLLDLMKNDTFVTSYYNVFSSLGEAENISHEFDTSEYGKTYGTLTLSASGVSGIIDASNGVNADSISISFADGKDVVAITEKDVSVQFDQDMFSSKARISMMDTRVYSGETLVSFDYSDSVDMASGEYSISVSNLVYKDRKIFDVSAVQKYVESQLNVSGGETPEPDDPNPDNPSIPEASTLVDQAAGEVFNALNSTNIISGATIFFQTLTADISLDISDDPSTTTAIKTKGPLNLSVQVGTSGVLYIDLTGVVELIYDGGEIPMHQNGETYGTITLEGFLFSIDSSGAEPVITIESETGYEYEVSESFKNTDFDVEVSAETTAGICASFIISWMSSESGVPGLSDENVSNAFDFDVSGAFGEYDVVSISLVTNYASMTNKAEYSGVFTLTASADGETQPRLKAIINVDKTSEGITYVIEELSRGSSKADIDNLSSSTSDAIKTFVETYGAYLGNA